MTTNIRRQIPILSFLKTPYFGETMATATMIPTVPPESIRGYLGVSDSLLKRSHNVSSPHGIGSLWCGAGHWAIPRTTRSPDRRGGSSHPSSEKTGAPRRLQAAGVIKEDVQKLRGFRSATPTKHPSSKACSLRAGGRRSCLIVPPFLGLFSPKRNN